MDRVTRAFNSTRVDNATEGKYNDIMFNIVKTIDGLESITAQGYTEGTFAFNIVKMYKQNANTSINFYTDFDFDILSKILAEFDVIKDEVTSDELIADEDLIDDETEEDGEE